MGKDGRERKSNQLVEGVFLFTSENDSLTKCSDLPPSVWKHISAPFSAPSGTGSVRRHVGSTSDVRHGEERPLRAVRWQLIFPNVTVNFAVGSCVHPPGCL